MFAILLIALLSIPYTLLGPMNVVLSVSAQYPGKLVLTQHNLSNAHLDPLLVYTRQCRFSIERAHIGFCHMPHANVNRSLREDFPSAPGYLVVCRRALICRSPPPRLNLHAQ